MGENNRGFRQDPAFQAQVRLAIVAALINRSPLDFKNLKEITGATDGNLSNHTQKLEEWEYIKVDKRIEGRRPKTRYHLTPKGREAFIAYVKALENIVKESEEN